MKMQRIVALLLATVLFIGGVIAQDRNYVQSGNSRFAIKVQPFMGSYLLASSNLKEINPNGPAGLNFGVEFPSSQQRPWQQYLNNPTVGLGMSYINLGDKAMGTAISMYPYIMINGFR